jgi:hypothetical protein
MRQHHNHDYITGIITGALINAKEKILPLCYFFNNLYKFSKYEYLKLKKKSI